MSSPAPATWREARSRMSAAFHIIFGKTVPDISLNAVANLGYAEARFLAPVYPGDTLNSVSEVIGLRENSNGASGVVWVRSTGFNQHGAPVLSYVRWVMVRKRDRAAVARPESGPDLAPALTAARISPFRPASTSRPTISPWPASRTWGDYQVGERIDHVDRVTIEEAEHMIATRL